MPNIKRARSSQLATSTTGFAAQPAPRFTAHARRRAAQRNLPLDALRYIMTYGREIQRTGVTFFALARRDIPPEDLRLPWIARLEGAVALVSGDGAVITLYRDPTSFRAILRKVKYYAPRRAHLRDDWSPACPDDIAADGEERELA